MKQIKLNKEKFEAGIEKRREVMGEDFVERALSTANEFTLPAQKLITEMAWGTVWQSEVLDKKTRSLMTLSILVALKASNELKGHVRGALNNGVSIDEIQDCLLHATVYSGAPAGLEAFRAADEVIQLWQQESRAEDN